MMYEGASANKVMWDRAQQDSISLLRWAEANKDNESEGARANALHILYNYHMGGWCGASRDRDFANYCLEEAAKLGHTQAAYDFAREFMRDRSDDTEKYVQKALSKIDDSSFDFYTHKQKFMENELQGLLGVIAYMKKAPRPRCVCP